MKDKGATPEENRFGIPPKQATLPTANINHTNYDDGYDSEGKEEYNSSYKDTYSDIIDPD